MKKEQKIKTWKEEVLAKITPSVTEKNKFTLATNSFLKNLNFTLKKEAQGVLGGSGAKDTWLSGNHDVDIFVQFNYQKYSSESEKLSEHLERALKTSFPNLELNRLHGSRDYFQMSYENICFEVIPILKVSKAPEAKNITDLSPLHSGWVNKHTQKLKGDIRLAKQFCKANKLYGAESYIGGFSGYVLEILIAHYGSFEKLLLASQKWKEKEVVDPENYYPKKDALFNLNSSKRQSPLILIDPTDKNRNAAAALSKETWEKFRKLAKEFLKKKAVSFFQKTEASLEKLREEARKSKVHLLFLEIKPFPGKEDVTGAKLVKALEFITEQLAGFVVKKSGWEWDKQEKAAFYFFLEKNQLPAEEIHSGPPLAMKEHAKEFQKKYAHTYNENGRIYAKVKIEQRELKGVMQKVIAEKYWKERIKEVKVAGD